MEKCTVCGQAGGWVALDSTTGESRCINHIGSPRISNIYISED